ncbi:hypothetical protein SAMN05192543_103454 [Paraburkholderia megapolitana]|uniref:Uncharacterized protein n=1 Tax=Paraburkholderia megapolitana TaxID=420953 RepID=A0A1I3IX50_9BURK|nr:hypothetical protein SAMN05192543_103454 [Paraburkholderia megapolitana]
MKLELAGKWGLRGMGWGSDLQPGIGRLGGLRSTEGRSNMCSANVRL